MTEFPKLRNGGGFELLRCAASTRQLELIPFSISNSPKLLKPWIGNARIYIRPIQVNLDLTPTEGYEEEVQNCVLIGQRQFNRMHTEKSIDLFYCFNQ